MEEILLDAQDLIYAISYNLEMARYFAYGVAVAFILVFIGLVIINSKLRTALSDHEVLQEEIRELKQLIKGELEYGKYDEFSDQDDRGRS